jgi:hypothetical protein
MNPRYRRLLIPGLLVALLIIVLVSSLARKADGAEAQPVVVSHIRDPRIAESSGLAVSRAHDDLAYTINDSNNPPYVFAIRVSTGAVVGVTRVGGGTLRDTEAIAIDRDGTLWVADTGDNANSRSDAALYAFPEPGAGNHAVTAKRYPVTYEAGPENVEALVISPTSGRKYLVSKGLFGGSVFALPVDLVAGRAAEAAEVDADVPAMVTDGTFANDGSYVLLRSYTTVYVFDPASWTQVDTMAIPAQQQGESIAMEASGHSMLVGSEGADSALIRLAFTAPERPIPTATPTTPRPARSAAPSSEPPTSDGVAGMVWVWAAAAVALLAGVAVLTTRRR